MSRLLERLSRGEILVGDGAMGTMLMEMGLETGACPERWNLDHQDRLEEVARLYLEAGADLIETNTFGGSPLKLAQYGLEDETETINRKAVEAVRKSVGNRAFVSGSVGPTGRMLQPYGDIEPEEMALGFERQINSLLEAGVDLICIETMTDKAEAILAVQAARKLSPDIPVAATMTFDITPRGFFTVMGVTVEQAIESLTEAGADIVGSNCGNGIENMVKIAAEFRRLSDRYLLIQSNAGLPEIVDGRLVYAESPEFMARHAEKLLELGVNIVGGCCGTTPDHIKATKKTVSNYLDAHR